MNLELLESFGQNFPEEPDGTLDSVSIAVTCQFNKWGTLLGVGCNDGRIVIWDVLTRGIAKIITAHVHPVCSLSWSRYGKKLVSASTDNTVCVWEVLTGECVHRVQFPAAVLKVQYNPRDDNSILVCPMRHAAVLLHLSKDHQTVPLDEDGDTNIVASYDRRGEYVYTGNSKGKVLVYRTTDLSLVASFRVTLGTASTTSIKSIEFSRRGEWFLINTADRVIRVYDSMEVVANGKDGETEPVQKLQDLVNKTTWKKCCFSGDGEYLCAGSARNHALYIWEKSGGNLVKILHGNKGEVLLDVVWHPVRPMIASISSGVVQTWAQNQVENWSAFAPDFKELDENVEYEERESEFDLEDEDRSVEAGTQDHDEDLDIDVVSYEKVPAFCSSDEEGDEGALTFLPIAPEVEDPEEWQGTAHPDTKENSPPRKKKYKSYDIKLDGPECDEPHPLLQQWRSKDKASGAGKKPIKSRNEKRPNK